jgi:hypothetical protein
MVGSSVERLVEKKADKRDESLVVPMEFLWADWWAVKKALWAGKTVVNLAYMSAERTGSKKDANLVETMAIR